MNTLLETKLMPDFKHRNLASNLSTTLYSQHYPKKSSSGDTKTTIPTLEVQTTDHRLICFDPIL